MSHKIADGSEKINAMTIPSIAAPQVQEESKLKIWQYKPLETAPTKDKSTSEIFSDFFEFDANF